MATYKVWLTVKDSYGKTKELDGGNVDISLDEKDVETIADSVKDLLGISGDTPPVQKPSSGELPGDQEEPGNSDGPENPDDSDESDTPTSSEEIINNIVANKLSMYTVTLTGSIEQVPYKLLTYDETTYAAAPTETGFYQKKD